MARSHDGTSVASPPTPPRREPRFHVGAGAGERRAGGATAARRFIPHIFDILSQNQQIVEIKSTYSPFPMSGVWRQYVREGSTSEPDQGMSADTGLDARSARGAGQRDDAADQPSGAGRASAHPALDGADRGGAALRARRSAAFLDRLGREDDPREEALLALFRALPSADQDSLLRIGRAMAQPDTAIVASRRAGRTHPERRRS